MRYKFFDTEIDPHFDPSINLPGFETFESANQRQEELIRHFTQHDRSNALLPILRSCRKDSRCYSAACDKCLRRFRRVWCSKLAKSVHEDGSWYSISLVPPTLIFPINCLGNFDLTKFKDRLRQQINRTFDQERIVIGGLDIAIQEFDDKCQVWRPHFYFLTRGGGEGRNENLGRFYSANCQTVRPVRSRIIGATKIDALKAATYTYKSQFQVRAPDWDRRGNRDSAKVPFNIEHRVQLAPHLHRWGFGGRLFRHGAGPDVSWLNVR